MEANEPISEPRRGESTQFLPGMASWLATRPFVRELRGFEKVKNLPRCLFVANHVSLLDAVTIGGTFTRFGLGPMLILADKSTWDTSWVKRWLSDAFAFRVERGKINPARIRELQAFGEASSGYHLLVFPEGTRGNGVDVAECQPGIFYIAQAAKVPIVPIFFENMQLVSTKTGKFHLLGGLQKVVVHFGEPIAPDEYLRFERAAFPEFIRSKISGAKS